MVSRCFKLFRTRQSNLPPRELYPRLNVRTDQPRLGLRKIRGLADDIRWIMPIQFALETFIPSGRLRSVPDSTLQELVDSTA